MMRRNFKKLDNNDFLLIYKTYMRPCTSRILCPGLVILGLGHLIYQRIFIV